MLHSFISSDRIDRFRDLSFVFLLLAFALFPIAHLNVVQGVPIYWSEAAIGCSFLVYILRRPNLFFHRISRLFREERLFFFLVGLFLLGIVSSFIINPHTISGWGEIKSFYIVPALFLIAILLHIEKSDDIEILAFAWLFGVAAASLVGVIAYLSGWLTYDGRLASLYLSPNYLAMLVAPGVLLSIFFFSGRVGKRHQWTIVFLGSATLFSLWATRSYAAWLAVVLACFVTWLFWRIGRARPYTALLAVLVLFLGVAFLHERGTEKWQSLVSGSDQSSLASRIMIWQAAVKISVDAFPVGIGTGRFQTVYLENQENFPPYLEWAVPTPHNLYLHFLIEGGALAFIGWIGCVAVVLSRGFRNRYQEVRSYVVMLGFVLVAFYLVYGLVDTPYMKNDLVLAVWGSLGFYLGALRIKA